MSKVVCCYLQDEHLTATLNLSHHKSRGHVTFNSLTTKAHLGMERQYPCQKFGPTFCICTIICSMNLKHCGVKAAWTQPQVACESVKLLHLLYYLVPLVG